MITDLIKQKMVFTNLTQAKLAEMVGTSPTQFGLFLKGEGASLPIKSLQKCFDALEINTDVYLRLHEAATKVAAILKSRGYDTEKILRLSKDEMISLTNAQELKYLIELSDEEEIEELRKSGLVDYQTTFPYFKSMVVYLMMLGDKTSTRTSSTVKNSLWTSLLGSAAVVGMLVGGIGTVGATVVSALGEGILSSINKDGMQPLEALRELTKKIIKIK